MPGLLKILFVFVAVWFLTNCLVAEGAGIDPGLLPIVNENKIWDLEDRTDQVVEDLANLTAQQEKDSGAVVEMNDSLKKVTTGVDTKMSAINELFIIAFSLLLFVTLVLVANWFSSQRQFDQINDERNPEEKKLAHPKITLAEPVRGNACISHNPVSKPSQTKQSNRLGFSTIMVCICSLVIPCARIWGTMLRRMWA